MMTKFSRILSEAINKREVLPDGTVRYEDDIYIQFIKDDMRHRIDGPAFIDKKLGMEQWYLHGKLHRIDGPAYTNEKYGVEEYWVNDRKFTKEEFEKHFGGE